VTRNRGTLGAVESRLETTINNLTVARENFMAAESVIRDVDVAAESAELTRLTILQQAGTAILAQANQQPRLALQLLQGG
jgi:flagellin